MCKHELQLLTHWDEFRINFLTLLWLFLLPICPIFALDLKLAIEDRKTRTSSKANNVKLLINCLNWSITESQNCQWTSFTFN